MLRGFPHIHMSPCPDCKGTGRIRLPFAHDCTSCNGTGLNGEPRWAITAALVYIAIIVAIAMIAYKNWFQS